MKHFGAHHNPRYVVINNVRDSYYYRYKGFFFQFLFFSIFTIWLVYTVYTHLTVNNNMRGTGHPPMTEPNNVYKLYNFQALGVRTLVFIAYFIVLYIIYMHIPR